MASNKKPVYKIETNLVGERKRRRSDLVVMWHSICDVTSLIVKDLWLTLLGIWELFEIWFSSSERYQILTWLEKYFPYAPDDFSDSWRDGRLMAILLNKLHPGCFPDADKLDPEYGLRNVYKVFNVLETYFGITPNITAEEILTCCDGSDAKLFEILLQLKRLNENQPESENHSQPENSEAENDEKSTVNMHCIAQGTGLAVGFVGRVSTFIIFYSHISDLDVVIDIRGPTTVYSEKITKRSPKKKRPTLNFDFHKPITRSLSCNDNLCVASCELSKDWENKTIPLEYEIIGNQISVGYKPKENGFHRLTILCHGQHVSDSPYSVFVEDFTELTGKDSLVRVKSALKSAKETEKIEESRNSVRFRESNRRDREESSSFGKVRSKRVICYIVKINGQDIPVHAENTESLATELLKMDYSCDNWPSFHRRNSWGFTGDAERKKSVIRQFGIDIKELELQSSQRRPRSLSANPGPKKLLEKSGSFDNLPSRLNIVQEDSLEHTDRLSTDGNDSGLVFSRDDLDMTVKTTGDKDERPANENADYYIKDSTSRPSESNFEGDDRNMNTNDDVTFGEIGEREFDSVFDSINSEEIGGMSENVHSEYTYTDDSGFDSTNINETQSRLNDLTSNYYQVNFPGLSSSETDLIEISRLSTDLCNGNEVDNFYKDFPQDYWPNVTLAKEVCSLEKRYNVKVVDEPTTNSKLDFEVFEFPADETHLTASKQNNALSGMEKSVPGKNQEKEAMQCFKTDSTNSIVVSNPLADVISDNIISNMDVPGIADVGKEQTNTQTRSFQGIVKYSEKEVVRNVTKSSKNKVVQESPANVEENTLLKPSKPLKSHCLKRLIQFNFKQFNPAMSVQGATSPVKGQIKLWERTLSSENQNVGSKTNAADTEGVSVKDKLAFWENTTKTQQSPTYPKNIVKLDMCSTELTEDNGRISKDFLENASRTAEINNVSRVVLTEVEQTRPGLSDTVDAENLQPQIQTENSIETPQNPILNYKEDCLQVETGIILNHSPIDAKVKDQSLDAVNQEANTAPNKHADNKISHEFRYHHRTRSFSDPGLIEAFNNSLESSSSSSFKLLNHGQSCTSNDNFEWTKSGSESGSDTYHRFSQDEYIDDEITEKVEYWGDLRGLKGLKLSHHNEYSLCEDFYKNQFQRMKSYPEQCIVFGIAAYYGYVAEKNRFVVYTGDAGFGTLSAGVQGFGSDDVTLVSVNHVRSGIYEVTYQVMTVGYYLISIRWLDQAIPGSPFVCKVTY